MPNRQPHKRLPPDRRDELHDAVVDCWHDMWPDLSVDDLLTRPRDATQLCQVVRRKLKHADLADQVILRSLLSMRKRGGLTRPRATDGMIAQAIKPRPAHGPATTARRAAAKKGGR